MRVLLLNGRLSERGGADRWLLGVLAQLQGKVETLLAAGYQDRHLPACERERIGRWTRVKGLDARGRRDAAATARRLARLIDDFDPDVVHANDVVDSDLLDVVASSGRGMQTVQDHRFFCPGRGKVDASGALCAVAMGEPCFACFDESGYATRTLALTRRRLAALARMRAVTVLSNYMARELAAVGIAPERIACIPPFVDRLEPERVATSAPGRGEFHLLAGRLSAHKGVAVALDAARQSELPVVVAGDGPLASAVRADSERSGSCVRYVGWVGRAALADLFRRARSLWLPGLWAEPFGIVGLEAMANGVPVIASDAGGVRDWLDDGESGLLVAPGDHRDLARAANRLGDDPELAHRLGERGRARAARFAPAPLMRRLLDVYREVAADRARQPLRPPGGGIADRAGTDRAHP